MTEELIPIKHLMENYRSLYKDGSWPKTKDMLLELDSEVIELLRLELRRDGRFREPIFLSKEDDGQIVADGTHRLIATQLEGLKEVFVTFEIEEANDDYCIKTNIILNEIPSDSIFESVSDLLRSVKVSDDFWITSLMTSGDSKVIEVFWDTLDVSKIEIVNSTVEEVLKDFNIESIETYQFVYPEGYFDFDA